MPFQTLGKANPHLAINRLKNRTTFETQTRKSAVQGTASITGITHART